MSAAARIIDHLVRVKQTGSGRWIARCPAHEDHSPSLSIREVDGGRVLLHDFGGCATADILAALGLGLADLFEHPLEHHRPRIHSRVPAADVLAALDHEVVTADILIEGAISYPLNELARDRLSLAVQRIGSAASYVRGIHQ